MEGSNQEEEEVPPPPYNQGVVCVPNYWVVRQSQQKVAKWRVIHVSNTSPPILLGWEEKDEAELKRIADKKIDVADTFFGLYAAMQKKNAVAAVLDFTDEEWESLKQLKECNMMMGMTNSTKKGNGSSNGGGWGQRMGQMGVKSMRRKCECII